MEIVIGNLIDFTIMINVTIIMKITIHIIMEIIMKSSLIGVFYELRVGAHVLVFSGFPWHSLFFWVWLGFGEFPWFSLVLNGFWLVFRGCRNQPSLQSLIERSMTGMQFGQWHECQNQAFLHSLIEWSMTRMQFGQWHGCRLLSVNHTQCICVIDHSQWHKCSSVNDTNADTRLFCTPL